MSTVIDQRKNTFWDVDGREKLAQGNSRLSCSLNFPQNGNIEFHVSAMFPNYGIMLFRPVNLLASSLMKESFIAGVVLLLTCRLIAVG